MYGLFWFIDMTQGNRDYAGLHHSCEMNLIYLFPMLVINLWCALINLAIWISFVASVHFIVMKRFNLVIWARKRIILWLVFISIMVVLFPLGFLIGL